jgi:hypothetical protein
VLLAAAVAIGRPALAGEPARDQLTEAQLDRVLGERIGDLDRCNRRERPRLGALVGRLDLDWEIRDSGKVSFVAARGDTLGSPELRHCVEDAIARWVFPRFKTSYVKARVPFVFGPRGVTFSSDAGAFSTVPDVEGGAKAMRALLLRFGPRFVSMACVAGKRSFLGNVCDTPIAADPRVGLDRRYTTDASTAEVARALLRFEHDRVDASGFALRRWPRAPGEVTRDVGPLDGFAVWPPGAFQVTLTAYGELSIHAGVRARCWSEPWSPCTDADQAPAARARASDEEAWPAVEGPLAGEVERLLAPVLRRLAPGWKLRTVQTLSVDLDGDGTREKLLNVAVTGVQMRPVKQHGQTEYPEAPTVFFFIFVEQDGHLRRLPVQSPPSRFHGVDGAVLGWLDIDGDGRPELLIETPGYESFTWQLVRLGDGAFHTVGDFGWSYWGEASETAPPE